MKYFSYILVVLIVLLCGCSVKRNNFFSQNYHQLTTRYNVYFNGNQAVKSGEKIWETGMRKIIPTFCLFLFPIMNRRGECVVQIWTMLQKRLLKQLMNLLLQLIPDAGKIRIRRIIRLSVPGKNSIINRISVIFYWEKLISISKKM